MTRFLRLATLLSMSVRVVLALLCLSALPTNALAQDDAAEAEARARFEAGRVALAAGHNESALADFRAAYALSPRPELLYDVGVAADRLRLDAEALEAFERYLAEMPADQIPNRAEVEARIVVLRGELAAPVEPPPPAASSSPDTSAIALVTVGAVVLVAGAVTLGIGIADRASVEGAAMGARWPDLADAASRAPVLEAIGGAAIGVGAALVLVSAVWLASSGRAPDRASLTLRTQGLGLSLGGTF